MKSGEQFIRNCVSNTVHCCMKYGNMSLEEAVKKTFETLEQVKNKNKKKNLKKKFKND